jgi:hypothetical protein
VIYFVQLDQGVVKIGHTDYWHIRLTRLRRAHHRVKLLHLMEGGRAVEGALCRRFAHLEIRNTGLFRPAMDLMRFIGTLRGAPPITGRWIFTMRLCPRAIRHLITARGDELNN